MSSDSTVASLAARTATSAGWIIGWRMATRLLGLVSTFVLVRVLVPADFGLVALASSFAQAIDWLSSFGVNEALIREEKLDRDLYDTGFTLNLMRGLAMALIIAAGAWPVALFFHDERLIPILLILAAMAFFMAIENIGTVDFRRDLAFHKDFQLSVVPRAVSIAVSIAVALVFRNYWALVAGVATNRVLRLLMSYRLHPYRPQLGLRAWRSIFGFSFWSWICSIVAMLRDRVDTVIIGRIGGPAQVGIYALGWEIGALTSTELVEPVTAALFAGFSAGRRGGHDLAEGYLKAMSATFALTLPLGLGLSMFAAPIIGLGFGPDWAGAVPLVEVFALVCTARVIAYISTVLLNAYGMVRVQFGILLTGLVVRVCVLLMLVQSLGLMGAAIAATACTAVEEVLYLLVTFRRFRLRPADLLRATWRSMLAGLVMVLILAGQGIAWMPAAETTPGMGETLVRGAATGAATYISVLLAAWWIAGRPNGAETALLGMAATLARRLREKGRMIRA